jgi:hypothetical protein
MPRHHKLKNVALVIGVMLAVMCIAPCEQKLPPAEEQLLEKIEKRIEAAYDLWCSKPEESRETYDATIRQILGSLSEDDIRLVAQNIGFECEREAYRMWARFDPSGALRAVRAFEDKNADEIKLAGTGLEGGPGEAMQGYVFEMYLGAIEGWSEVDPKVAWESFKERKGPLSNSLVIDDFVCDFYRVLCEHLAKVDPDRAFNELISFRSDDYEEMIVASMLGGYLRSAPRGRDWRKEVNQLLEREWRHGWWLHSEIRTALMGRWLQDDAETAERWFLDSDVEGLSWSYRNDQKDVKIRNGLGSAAGYWAARDFPAAWNWMKSYNGFKRKGFGAAVLHGADVFLTKRDAYFVAGGGVRAPLLAQAAKLPEELGREACIAMLQDAEPNAEYLDPVIEQNRSSEQDGADQPATAPESKPEGDQNAKPESEVRPQ